jgi:hypothetical protein
MMRAALALALALPMAARAESNITGVWAPVAAAAHGGGHSHPSRQRRGFGALHAQ